MVVPRELLQQARQTQRTFNIVLGAITRLSGWNTSITPWAVAIPLAMSILAGIFFGLYLAIQAFRMDPVTALRHE